MSVVVPSLNRASVIRAALDSILGQTYPAIECIVADGGSNDGTLEILRSYDNRIRWRSGPDSGQADAIDNGLRESTGDICTWLNADDVWWDCNAVSRVVAAFATEPTIDVVYGDCGAIDDEGRLVGDSYVNGNWDFAYALEHADHCIAQPASFIRRSALERVGYINTRKIFMDWDLWLRLGFEGKFMHIPTKLAAARVHTDHWHRHYDAAAAEWVATLRATLDDPRIPPEIRAKRGKCIANGCLRAMQYQWMGGNLWKTLRWAERAARANPRALPDALHLTKRIIRERLLRHR